MLCGILLAPAQSTQGPLSVFEQREKLTNGRRGAVLDQIKTRRRMHNRANHRKAGVSEGKQQLFLVSLGAEGTSVTGPLCKHLLSKAEVASSSLNCWWETEALACSRLTNHKWFAVAAGCEPRPGCRELLPAGGWLRNSSQCSSRASRLCTGRGGRALGTSKAS